MKNVSIFKALTFFMLSAILICINSCGTFVENSAKYKALQAKLDSLQCSYGVKSSDLDEAFATLNEIEHGLKSIRESENILSVKSKEGMEVPNDTRVKIKDDITAISQAIKQYQNEISKLKNSNKIQSAQFNKRLNNLQKELGEKLKLITSLHDQLDEKDAVITIKTQQINSLDQIVSNLRENVEVLSAQSEALKEKVQSQEKELYSVYYIIGTKQDLIDAGVLTKGGLFKSSKISYQSEKDSFVKIDYREINIINTNSAKAKVLSIHPKGTYSLDRDNDEVLLTISNPDEFWEQTKYLVIQTN